MQQASGSPAGQGAAIVRSRTLFAVLLVIFGLFIVRLFYLQVIRYDYYKKSALSDQLKEATVTAERGTISAHMGEGTVPIVLNQKLYTLYADPTIIKDPNGSAGKLSSIIGRSDSDIARQLKTKDTRYVVLQRKLTPEQNTKVLALKLPGIGTQGQDYRTYPQGTLAAQTLGFVNNDGKGVYGVEQALNTVLTGTPGMLKAVTDINGVPLAASSDNLSVQPVAGQDVTLTLDVGMQSQLEGIVKAAAEKNDSKDVSAVILDVHSGAIKAMANYPSYDPAHYDEVSDAALFQNDIVSQPIETGSIMKVLTAAAGIDSGAITANSSFYDPAKWVIDGFAITDVAEDGGPRQQNIETTLNLSLNTGAAWILMQMGGGQINEKARNAWHDYMVDHFQLGKLTNVEQGYESSGTIPGPKDDGAAINLTYAETAFGQAMSATALQMGAAFVSVLNGGTYYQPTLVDRMTAADGTVTENKPKVVRRDVVSASVSKDIIRLLEKVNDDHIAEGFSYLRFPPGYSVGGKTGSAQLALPGGGYSATDFNATFMGFVGGDTPQYAVVVYNIEPHIAYGYAGAQAAQPIFATIAHMLVDDYAVTPRS